ETLVMAGLGEALERGVGRLLAGEPPGRGPAEQRGGVAGKAPAEGDAEDLVPPAREQGQPGAEAVGHLEGLRRSPGCGFATGGPPVTGLGGGCGPGRRPRLHGHGVNMGSIHSGVSSDERSTRATTRSSRRTPATETSASTENRGGTTSEFQSTLSS